MARLRSCALVAIVAVSSCTPPDPVAACQSGDGAGCSALERRCGGAGSEDVAPTSTQEKACRDLARVLEGRGANIEAARTWKRVAERWPPHDLESATLLAFSLSQHPESVAQGLELMRVLCNEAIVRDPWACFNEGLLRRAGEHVPHDDAAALRAYERGCVSGEPPVSVSGSSFWLGHWRKARELCCVALDDLRKVLAATRAR